MFFSIVTAARISISRRSQLRGKRKPLVTKPVMKWQTFTTAVLQKTFEQIVSFGIEGY
jgi:hypothetical protein